MAKGCKTDARTYHKDAKNYARNMVLGYQTDTKYMARKCKTNARNLAQGCKTDARTWLKDAKLMQEHGTGI